MGFKQAVSPRDIVAHLAENDPTLVTVNLSNNAVMQTKSDQYVTSIAEALRRNTACRELNLARCGVTDVGARELGRALAANAALEALDLEGNSITSAGASHIAKGFAHNTTLLRVNLLGQSRGAFGDACLGDFVDAFDTNVTLLKITWRLTSRKAFALSKMLTRNNEILRRCKTGREFQEMLPEHMRGNVSEIKGLLSGLHKFGLPEEDAYPPAKAVAVTTVEAAAQAAVVASAALDAPLQHAPDDVVEMASPEAATLGTKVIPESFTKKQAAKTTATSDDEDGLDPVDVAGTEVVAAPEASAVSDDEGVSDDNIISEDEVEEDIPPGALPKNARKGFRKRIFRLPSHPGRGGTLGWLGPALNRLKLR